MANSLLNNIADNVISFASAIANEKVLTPTAVTDPELQAALSKLEGKVIAFELKKVNQTFYFLPTSNSINIVHDAPATVDVTIRAKPSTVFKIAKDGIDNAELDSGELEIEGDAITGQRFSKLLGEIDIDWEELLSQRIGDVPAHMIAKGLTAFQAWSGSTKDTLKQNMGEYITEEARLAASDVMVEKYLDDVDDLRNDVARLAARVKNLTASKN